MRAGSLKGEGAVSVAEFLHVRAVKATGHRAAARTPSFFFFCSGPDDCDDGMVHRQMAMARLSPALQRWHGDGTEVFRLAAPRQASPPNSKGRAITALAGGLATPIQPRRMYNKIQAGPAGKLHTGRTSKEMDTVLFFFPSIHISLRGYIVHGFYLKKQEQRQDKQIHEQCRMQACFLQPFFLV